jgi:hypothetical protein
MKKVIAFLMALAMVVTLIPMESAHARGRRGRSGGVQGRSNSSKGRRRNNDAEKQKLQKRGKSELTQSLKRRCKRDRQV